MARVYKLAPSALPSLKRTTISIVLVIAAVVLGISIARPSSKSLVFTLPIVLLAVGYGLYSGVRRNRLARESFELLVSDDFVVRRMAGWPELEIHRDEVTAIFALRSRALVIRGRDTKQMIIVPRGLEGYDEVLRTLGTWKEPQTPRGPLSPEIRTALLSGAMLALLGTAFIAQNPWIVAPACAMTFGVLVWAVWYIQKNPAYPADLKKWSWVVTLPALWMLVRVLLLAKGTR